MRQLFRRISLFLWLASLLISSSIAGAVSPSADLVAARQHWAYQPIRQPPIPKVSGPAQSPVDNFVIEKLASKGLALSAPADRAILIRRAYYDLIGLPPSYEEIEDFARDQSSDAFAKVVDRLLGSPRYGERWARHWLDVARYADTKDLVLLFGKDRLRPYAYTYRDYVIRAFNDDTPFDQFISEQIAADQITPKVEPWRLAALGFLTLGRLYDNNPHDQIDDQIDTVTRGFLGLTVSCARCHDHKYDAIPTADYYSLYGVFASSERAYDLPLIEDPTHIKGGPAFEARWSGALKKLQDHIDSQYAILAEASRRRVGDYLVRVATTQPDLSETASFFLSLTPQDLRPALVLHWRRYLEEHAKGDRIFGLWADLMALPDENFADRAKELVNRQFAGSHPQPPINPLVAEAFRKTAVTNKAEMARVYGKLFETVLDHSKMTNAPEARALAQNERELWAVLTAENGPVFFPKNQTPQHMSRPDKDKYNQLVGELDKLAAFATNRPPARAMIVSDTPEPYHPRIFVRGSPARPGEPVPRAFLQVLAGKDRKPFPHGSGRIDLARAIAAPENPLTARVLVNRVWMHHFGEPLVSTPNDFGNRSAPPTHPELLDFLASNFIREGWSMKKLHRLMVLSSVYQQASSDRPNCRQIDPENRLLWRANRRRLDLEAMRDSLLSVSGRLDLTMGGPSVDVAGDPRNCRRTVYGVVDRQDLAAMFRAFDFASPDASAERRPRTTVPQQALFAMNSPFVFEQIRALRQQAEAAARGNVEHCVEFLYRRILSREPARPELDRALRFISEAKADPPAKGETLSPVEQFAQVLLMTNELMFVD